MLKLADCGRRVDGMSVESKLYMFWICLFLGIFLILEAAQ